jgi:hypothetical protein
MFVYLQTKLLTLFLVCMEKLESWLIYRPPRNVSFISDRKLIYTTSQGKQVAHYDIIGTPQHVFLCFGGASTTSNVWINVISKLNASNALFLYVDFPGYGLCDGKPTQRNIQESCEKALETLAKKICMDNMIISALGWSLGAAAAVQFALLHRGFNGLLVLVAPFSSISDMAAHKYGSFLAKFVTHHWDVTSMLQMIHRFHVMKPVKKIVVLYGASDEIIPVWMRERVTQSIPNITLYVNKNCDHSSILPECVPVISAEINS